MINFKNIYSIISLKNTGKDRDSLAYNDHSALYYGQEGEDAILCSILGDIKNGGFYVDVGAHHPIRFSNTLKLYQAGWRGINIDPNPGSMDLFKKYRPEDCNLEIAMGLKTGTRNFYCYNEPALNGIDNDRRAELEGTPYILEKIIEIPTYTLASILEEHGKEFHSPSILNIDVEGLEIEVLESNNWNKWQFDFLLVEQRLSALDKIGETQIYHYLSQLNYQPVASTKRTVIYKSVK